MATIEDVEFGSVTLRRSARASQVKIRVGTDGRLSASLPTRTPLLFVKRLIESSRPELRRMLLEHQGQSTFTDGMQIGKSHRLTARFSSTRKASATRHGQQIIVDIPSDQSINSAPIQDVIRSAVIEALRKEAKSYLPKRLSFLANQFGFTYKKVRFSHAAGRWGSCTSQGTISLNIALMKLPFEQIDYVLLHELSHTKEMNHSKSFWTLVAKCDPEYLLHRRDLKRQSPSI